MKETKFKHTEIGLIPEDWEVKKLGEVAHIEMGQSPSSENYNVSGIGLPLVQGNADIKNRKTIIRNYTSQITKKCIKGDIIMSVRAPVGEIAIASNDACIGRGVCAIRYSNKYLFHYLICIESTWSKHSTGSTFDSVNSDTIKNLEIPFPPIKEQTAIATALGDADALITALEKLIAKKKAIKQGAMQQLLKPKEGWVVKKLGEVGEIITGGTPPTLNKEYWNGNIPWITPTDITTDKNIYHSEREITFKGLSILRRIPKNSLLVTCIASIGKNAILRNDGACNQQINAIIPNINFNVDFLYYLMEFNRNILIGAAGITATLILSKKEFSEIEFSFPGTKEEQTRIAQILSDMDAEIEALEQKLEKQKQIKQGMMQVLLTGKIRLNHDAKGWQDAPDSSLNNHGNQVNRVNQG
ncbi:restriction endonuclease subunit S [Tenuifilum thalassicum]|uniref:Restriction endonuclease subunit S n=1 Tax=Tenuifilum thalassicum TaxID=2590900 RepID=A0A7D4CR36_9BACT|nr:restriction endonuclease subunit S [Tenuifilum thalassicum]QKG79885.1 restriction endonuclease subunit S [Tenuifilum thalassicum]